MKTVGHRRIQPLTLDASAELLRRGARFNEQAYGIAPPEAPFIPKGVYFFATLADADRHRDECLAAGMARRTGERS